MSCRTTVPDLNEHDFHSWQAPLDALIRMARRPDPAGRWRRAQTLVVDEVSMLDGALFDALEAVARAVRGSDAPFGGIQLVRIDTDDAATLLPFSPRRS